MTNLRKKASYGMLSDGYGSLHILSSIPVLLINLFSTIRVTEWLRIQGIAKQTLWILEVWG